VKLYSITERPCVLRQNFRQNDPRLLPRVLLNPTDFKHSQFTAGQLLRLVVDPPSLFSSVVEAWPSYKLKPTMATFVSASSDDSAQENVEACLQPIAQLICAVAVRVELLQVKNKYSLKTDKFSNGCHLIQLALRGMVVGKGDIHTITLDDYILRLRINQLETLGNQPARDLARVTVHTCIALESRAQSHEHVDEIRLDRSKTTEMAGLASEIASRSSHAYLGRGVLVAGHPGNGKLRMEMMGRCIRLLSIPRRKNLLKLSATPVQSEETARAQNGLRSALIVLNAKQVVGIAALGMEEAHVILRALFSHVSSTGSTLLIEELDVLSISAFTPVINILMSCLDSMTSGVIIAAYDRASVVSPVLNRSGRLDRVSLAKPPSEQSARDLGTMLKTMIPSDLPHYLSDLTLDTSGVNRFVNVDRKLIGKAILLKAFKEVLQTSILEQYWGRLSRTKICYKHALQARSQLLSRYQACEKQIPAVQWKDLGGLASVKRTLCELFYASMSYASTLIQLGVNTSACGVLLYGPPGCSKTMLARAIATECSMSFLTVLGPELLSMWLGDSERALHGIFLRAESTSPSIVFFDEVDALALRRTSSALPSESAATDRVLAQLLVELDGIASKSHIFVVAATNRPDLLDPALMRPGRLDFLLYIPPPDLYSRCEILISALGSMPVSMLCDSFVILQLARCSALCSGAEIIDICRHAALYAISRLKITRKSIPFIEPSHLFAAFANLDLSNRSKSLRFYERWQSGVNSDDRRVDPTCNKRTLAR